MTSKPKDPGASPHDDPGGKRVVKRARKRLMVRFGVDAPDRTAFTKNISATGLFLSTNQVMRPGTMIQVQIQFPERSIGLWAHVVWAKQVPAQLAHVIECGMGVRFIDPGPEWIEHFEKWKRTARVE